MNEFTWSGSEFCLFHRFYVAHFGAWALGEYISASANIQTQTNASKLKGGP